MAVTNFQKIQEEAIFVMEMDNCPEAVKDVFTRMIVDEKSLADVHKALAILTVHCSQYKEMVERIQGYVFHTIVTQLMNDPEGREPN